MALTAGSKLGPYEILARIGAGGMGEVFKARDTRINRTIAVKVAKERFSDRSHKEAEAIAALNHPHICHLYDVGPNYLVMEYVEGTPLKGPLPLERALKYADQICQALDEAHRKGITHRDLKPANILVTKSAGVKLLDFGLARVEGGENATVTMEGVKGTPAYMSPEQWQGKSGDARSDIYAFGCVLYEMLTGLPAAAQRTKLEPPVLESIVRTCMEQDPEDRWQSARDLRRALSLPPTEAPAKRNPWRERAAWMAAAVLALALIAMLFAVRPPASADAELARFSIFPPQHTDFTGPNLVTIPVPQFALSADGKFLAFIAGSPGAKPSLWLRALSGVEARLLPETEDAEYPFWSADDRWIGFFAAGKLKKVPVAGGPSQSLADVVDSRGGSWSTDDTIFYSQGSTGVFRVSSAGGPATEVTKPDASRGEGSHRFSSVLPNGSHFLYTMRSSLPEQRGVYVGSLDGKLKKLLVRGAAGAVYASRHLLYVQGDTLMAQVFDVEQLTTAGQPFALETQVGVSSNGLPSFSASQTGIVAIGRIMSAATSRLTWFDRTGKAAGFVGEPGDYSDVSLSPDQAHVATTIVDHKTGYANVWIRDLARGSIGPFTYGPGVNAAPVWSPDGNRIVFRSTRRGGILEFYEKSSGGGGDEGVRLSIKTALAAGLRSVNLVDSDWSPDGSVLLFSTIAKTDFDLWLLPLNGAPKPASLLAAPGDQVHAQFSPDGRLIAYTSNESGRFEVHVQTFPISDRQWTISTSGGGYEPRWRGDGRELYYLSEDRKLTAVAVGPGPSFGTPKTLFQTNVSQGVQVYRNHYVPSRDGQRFLVITQSGEVAPTPITVILNWTAALKK